jgi:hypothetical protein
MSTHPSSTQNKDKLLFVTFAKCYNIQSGIGILPENTLPDIPVPLQKETKDGPICPLQSQVTE